MKLYKNDPDFTSTYQILVDGKQIPNLHLKDTLLCYLGHLCVPKEHAKLIWEAHHNKVVGHFGVEKTLAVQQKYFYWPKLWQDVGKYIIFYIAYDISKLTITKQGLYTPLLTPNLLKNVTSVNLHIFIWVMM